LLSGFPGIGSSIRSPGRVPDWCERDPFYLKGEEKQTTKMIKISPGQNVGLIVTTGEFETQTDSN